MAIKLLDNDFVPVASPAYLAQHGAPRLPEDLQNHKALYYRTPVGQQTWYFQRNDQWHTVTPMEVAISNNGTWLAEKAVNHEGIMMAPRWSIAPYVERGELEYLNVEPELRVTQNTSLGVYLLYQKQRYRVPKIKAAVDFLVDKVQA